MANSDSEAPIWKRPIVIGAALVLVAASVFYFMTRTRQDQFSGASLSENVTLRDRETGEEWQMNRGLMQQDLVRRAIGNKLNENEGIVNPKTGKPNGFPVNEDWAKLTEKIRADIDAFKASQKKH